ncbi:MAG: ABC transporter ATP-binding protein [Candidatus Nitrosothermus koennekii]|nr:MAG: ABC transporter ATP-binding protein [Candidatus Nitrosothermus koennekii]
MRSLKVKDLKAYYFTSKGAVKALDGVSFMLKDGESVGIAGESGSGKSTLGFVLMRMLQEPGKVIDGSILLDDIDIIRLGNKEFDEQIRWKRIAMVFQGAMNSLDPVYKIRDQLVEIMQFHKYQGDFNKRAEEVITQVGLDRSVLDRYPHELSGGMKQRVVIAMALLLKPELLIADEPTTALDVLVQAQIMNLFKKLKKEGMNIMLITHDLAIISEIAERIGIMYAGELVEFNTSEEIYNNPKHPYTQALINAIPRLRGDKKLSYIKGNPPNLANPPKGCRFIDRCPHAMEICKKEPPLVKSKDGYVRCWLYDS